MRQHTTSTPTSEKHTLKTTETDSRQTTKSSDPNDVSTESMNNIRTNTTTDITTTAMDDTTMAIDVTTTPMDITKQTIDTTSNIYSSSDTAETTVHITNDKLLIVTLIAIIGMTVGIIVISVTITAVVIRCTIRRKKEEINEVNNITKQYIDEKFDYKRGTLPSNLYINDIAFYK